MQADAVAFGIVELRHAAVRIIGRLLVGLRRVWANALERRVDVVDLEHHAAAAPSRALQETFRDEREPLVVAEVELDEPRLLLIGVRAVDAQAERVAIEFQQFLHVFAGIRRKGNACDLHLARLFRMPAKQP